MLWYHYLLDVLNIINTMQYIIDLQHVSFTEVLAVLILLVYQNIPYIEIHEPVLFLFVALSQ